MTIYEGILKNNQYELGKHLRGYYGRFSEVMMENNLMFDTKKFVDEGYKLPFLVTEHRLNEEVNWHLPDGKKARNKQDAYGPPRTPKTSKKIKAIIYDCDNYKILTDD